MKTEEESCKNNSGLNMVNGKTSLQRLAEHAQIRRGRNNKAFLLAHWNEIVEALGAGWNLRVIWDFLHSRGEFPGSYDSFVKLTRAEQARLPNTLSSVANNQQKMTKQPCTTNHQEIGTKQPQEGFVYSPDSFKDLI